MREYPSFKCRTTDERRISRVILVMIAWMPFAACISGEDTERSGDAGSTSDTVEIRDGMSSDAGDSDMRRANDASDGGSHGDAIHGDASKMDADTEPECHIVRYARDAEGDGDDQHPDGSPEEVTTYQYDERERLKRAERRGRNNEGELDIFEVTTYEYDDRRKEPVKKVVDGNPRNPPDGEPDYVLRFQRRPDGKIERTEIDGIGSAPLDGNPEQIFVNEYDDRDRRIEHRVYRGPSSDREYLTRVRSYEYEGGEYPVRRLIDGVGRREAPDGTIDIVWRYQYNAERRRTRKALEYPRGASRAEKRRFGPEAIWLYRYDGNHRTHEAYYPSPKEPPSQLEPARVITYEYDDRGNRVRKERDGVFDDDRPNEKPDGEPEMVWTYDYECP